MTDKEIQKLPCDYCDGECLLLSVGYSFPACFFMQCKKCEREFKRYSNESIKVLSEEEHRKLRPHMYADEIPNVDIENIVTSSCGNVFADIGLPDAEWHLKEANLYLALFALYNRVEQEMPPEKVMSNDFRRVLENVRKILRDKRLIQ